MANAPSGGTTPTPKPQTGAGTYPNGKPIVLGGSLPPPQPLPSKSNPVVKIGTQSTSPKPAWWNNRPGPVPTTVSEHGQGGGTGPTKITNQTLGNPDVEAMQRFLNHHGYNLQVDGVLGPQTKAAAAAWRNRFNTKPSSTAPSSSPAKTDASSSGPQSTPTKTPGRSPASAGGGGGGKSGGGAATDPLTALLAGLNPNVGTMLDPKAYGNSIAGAQYDPSIYQDRVDLSRAPVKAQQDMADISNWYNQALQSMIGAGNADQTQNQAEQGSMGDAVAKIISSLGGSANQGSGLVGAAGADQVGNLAALGAIDKSFHNDMNPLMQGEAAGALTNQKNLETAHLSDLQHQLTSDLGARGQTAAADAYNAIGQNNQLAQQRFGNKFGEMQAIESAQIAGQNAAAKQAAAQANANISTAKTNAYIDHINAQDAHLAAQDAYTKWKEAHPSSSSKPTGFAAIIAKGKGGSVSNDIQNTFSYTQQDVTNGVVGADQIGKLKAGYQLPNGKLNVPKVVHDLNQQIRNMGYDSKDPAARSYRDMMLKKVFGITPAKAWEYNW